MPCPLLHSRPMEVRDQLPFASENRNGRLPGAYRLPPTQSREPDPERKDHRSQMRFENRVTQVAMCSFCALIGVIGVAELTNARTTVSGVIFTLLGGALAYRALQSSSVVVSDTEVTTRSMLRTRRYPFSELRGVDVAVGPTGVLLWRREHLVLHFADGRGVAFRELNCSRRAGPQSVVRRAAAAINGHLPAA